MSVQEDKEFHRIFTALRRRFWILAACFLIPIFVVYAITASIPPTYEAVVTLMIQSSQDQNTNDYSALIAGEQLAITYSQMIKTHAVLQTVIDQLGLKTNADALANEIKVTTITNTQLIRLTVSDPSPAEAARIANTVAKVLAEHTRSLSQKRYASALENVQRDIDYLTAQNSETQARRNRVNEQGMEQAAEIDQLNTILAQNQSNLSNMQQNYNALKITVTQFSDKIHVIGPAKIDQTILGPQPTAVVILLLDRDLIFGGNGYSTTPIGFQLYQSFGPMLTDETLLQEAISQLNLSISPKELASSVSTEIVAGTQLIRLRVTHPDALVAIQLANAIAGSFIDQIHTQLAEPYLPRFTDMQAQIQTITDEIKQTQADVHSQLDSKVKTESELTNLDLLLGGYNRDLQAKQQQYNALAFAASNAGGEIVITGDANVPDKPTSRRFLFLAAASIFGLLVGAVWAYLVERLGRFRIRNQSDITDILEPNVLSTVGHLNKGDTELIVDLPSGEVVQNDFHRLATKIHKVARERKLFTLLVTSPEPADGKSFVAANLAILLAKAGCRVVVVDADLRKPRQHEIFNLDLAPGLVDVLSSRSSHICLQPTPIPDLRILTGGVTEANPANVLSSPLLTKLFKELRKDADLVLVDCPPVLSSADPAILSSYVDGILLILRSGHTTNESIKDSIKSLNVDPSRLIGLILNQAKNFRAIWDHSEHDETKKKKDRLYQLRVKTRQKIPALFRYLSD